MIPRTPDGCKQGRTWGAHLHGDRCLTAGAMNVGAMEQLRIGFPVVIFADRWRQTTLRWHRTIGAPLSKEELTRIDIDAQVAEDSVQFFELRAKDVTPQIAEQARQLYIEAERVGKELLEAL